MGSDTARIVVAAVREAADQFDKSAGVLDTAINNHLLRLGFDGATAGRDHVAHGDALRAALDRMADGLAQWSRASVEIAAALRSTADRYAAADERNSERFG